MSASPPAAAPPRRRSPRRLLAACVLVIVLSGGTFAWLSATESGLRALMSMAAHFSAGTFRVEGVSGSLSGPFAVSRLSLELPSAKIEAAGLALDWRPGMLLRRELVVDRLRIDKLDVFLQASNAPPPSPPALPDELHLPLDVDLAMAELGELAIHGADDGKTRIFELRAASLSLRSDTERLLLRQLAMQLPQGGVEATGELGARAPFALRLDGKLTDEAFAAEIAGEGSLAEPVLRLSARAYGAQGRAVIEARPFAELPLQKLELDLVEFDPATLAPTLPHADLRLRLELAATRDDAGKPRLRGPLRLDNARFATFDAGGLPLASLNAEVTAAATLDELRLDTLVLEGGNGKLSGWLHWRRQAEADADGPAAATGFGQIDAALDVSALVLAQLDRRLPAHRLDGRLEAAATVRRQWGKASLRAGTAQIDGEASIVANEDASPTFVLGLDLREVDPAAFHPAMPPAKINLQASMTGVLDAQPRAAIHFTFGDSRLYDQPLGGRGSLTWDGASLRDVDLGLDFASNHLRLAGAWGASKDLLRFDLDAPRLAAIGHGLQGRLRVTGAITGGLLAPAGTVRLEAGKLRLPGEIDIAALAGEARLDAGEQGSLALMLDGKDFAIGDLRLETVRLEADGRRDQHRLHIKTAGNVGQYAIGLDAVFDGGLRALRWQGQILSLANGGQWPLRLRAPAALEIGAENLHLGEAKFELGEQGRIHLAETRWQNGAAVLRGGWRGLAVSLVPGLIPNANRGRQRDPLTLGADWDLRLGERIEGEAHLFRESGDLSVRGEISTRLGLDMLDAHLLARDGKLTLTLAAHGKESGELGARLEARLERTRQGWQLAPQAPLAGAARLHIPSLAWLGRLLRDNVDIGGAFTADLTLGGTLAKPDLQGKVEGHALQLSFADQGLVLAGGELEAGFVHHDGRQNLRLKRLAFESPNRVKPDDDRVPYAELTATPGRLLLTGDIALGESDAVPRGRFEFTAERLPLLQRPDRWLILSGQGRAELQARVLEVDARLRADAGYVALDEAAAPSLGDDVIIHRARDGDAAREEDNEAPFAVAGKIVIELGRALYLAAFGVDTRLGGHFELRLRPSESLRALGTIQTIGGSYRGYGQRLAIERGTLTFQGEPDNPSLNIVAMRRGMEVDAGVSITGDAHHPQVRLVSEPTVPDPEKLSWLVLGRAPDAGGGDLALLMPAAQALFGSGMSTELARGLGIDSFTIGQGELNSSSRTAASKVVGGGSRLSAGPAVNSDVVSVGKRLTSDLFLSFEQSLGGAESLLKLTYRLGRQWSLVARGGTDNAVDVYYTFAFGRERRRKAQQ
jgi:translocation and assembly module TamB